ncbi:MAG TPA: AAA family ATPase [Chthonomonadaceae bacterium]|nr:AAA family ATPase [Chthonomonadaceae bacterium]
MERIDLVEAATRYQISTHTLRNYIRAGKLTQYGVGKATQLACDELSALFAPRQATTEQRIFAICNHKGGVGKTTSAAALGWFLSRRAPTLMIDADPQGHLTQVYGFDSDRLERTLYEVMVKSLPIQDAILPVVLSDPPEEYDPQSLCIVGSNLELAETTLQVTGRPWWVKLLRNALRPVLETFQYVVIDCPPSLDALTVNAIAAATDIIVPVDMGAFSLRGTVKLLESLRHVSEELPNPPTVRFLATRIEPNQFTEDILEQLWRNYEGRVLNTVIRKAVDVGRAQMYRSPLPLLFPNNMSTHDYAALTRELLNE